MQHQLVPDGPADGDQFRCPHCGVSFTFVDLHDGQPGEWIDVTPPDVDTPSASD